MTAWYLSLAAEAWLAVECRRTPWGWFLLADLVRTASLLALPARSAENALWWLATGPVMLALQVRAVGAVLPHGARTTGRFSRWLLAAGGLAALAVTAIALSQDAASWDRVHHLMATAHRFAMVIFLAALLVSLGFAWLWRGPRAEGALGMTAYYAIEAAAIAAIATLGPGSIRPLNTGKALALAALFSVWAARRRAFGERSLGGTNSREGQQRGKY